jgi:aldose 1-epimerase
MIYPFGTAPNGALVQAITLRAGDISARILTWGAILQSVRLAGVAHDLTHGSDRLADYLGDMAYHGSLIGPVVNRISNAQAVIGGKTHQFEVNFNGRHTLHSGAAGAHRRKWDVIAADEASCTLGLTMPAGVGGFPGTRKVRAQFAMAAPASLTMTVTVTTDAETIINFANHSYWNLDGAPGWAGHKLQIASDAFLPCDADFKPTGEIRDVAGGEMDFRQPREIAPHSPDLDNCFVLSRGTAALRDVVWLTGKSGLEMTVATNEGGVQIYDGRGAVRPGRPAFEGIAVECQGWPDAPSNADFPTITLTPGQTKSQITQWRFAKAL